MSIIVPGAGDITQDNEDPLRSYFLVLGNYTKQIHEMYTCETVGNATEEKKSWKEECVCVCVCFVSVLNRRVGEGLTDKMTSGPRTEGSEQKNIQTEGTTCAKALGWICVGVFGEPCGSCHGRRRVNAGMLLDPTRSPGVPLAS